MRSIASIELLKGVLSVIAIVAVVFLLKRDVDFEYAALDLFSFLHIDPDRRVPSLFIDAVGKFQMMSPWKIVLLGGLYTVVRFIEGLGLWFGRVWAEWLAIVSGCIYLPIEIYQLMQKQTTIRWSVLFINIAIVAYIAYVRLSTYSREHPDTLSFPRKRMQQHPAD